MPERGGASGCAAESPVRTISSLEIGLAERDLHGNPCESGDILEIEVIGNGFLRHMVRNIVGTLVEAGRGRYHSGQVAEILAARNRGLAGPTAPPQGLILQEVFYSADG